MLQLTPVDFVVLSSLLTSLTPSCNSLSAAEADDDSYRSSSVVRDACEVDVSLTSSTTGCVDGSIEELEIWSCLTTVANLLVAFNLFTIIFSCCRTGVPQLPMLTAVITVPQRVEG